MDGSGDLELIDGAADLPADGLGDGGAGSAPSIMPSRAGSAACPPPAEPLLATAQEAAQASACSAPAPASASAAAEPAGDDADVVDCMHMTFRIRKRLCHACRVLTECVWGRGGVSCKLHKLSSDLTHAHTRTYSLSVLCDRAC